MKVLGVALKPYRKRIMTLDEPPETPARTPSGAAIKPGIVRALDRTHRATVACSDALDCAIVAARRVADSIPPKG